MQPTPPLTRDPVLEGYPGAQVAKHEAVRHLHMLTALASVLHGGQRGQGHWDQDQLDAAQQELARAYRKLGEPESQNPANFSQALPSTAPCGSASSVLAPYATALLPTYPRHLLRLLLLDYLPLFRQTVAELALTVLNKIPLAINRPLYTRSGGAVLAATPLLGLGQSLAGLEAKIADVIVELDSFGIAPSSHYEPFAGFHQAIAEGLGFTRLSHEQLPRELPIWQALKLQLDSVLADAAELTDEAKPLCGRAFTEAAESAISEATTYLQGAEQALATLEGDAGKPPIPAAAYAQRVQLGQKLHGGLVSLRQLDIAMREFYSSGTAEDPVAPPMWFVWRPFTQFLIAQGVEAMTAIEQCAEVRAYCEAKSVHPKDLAAEELRVIKPELKQAAQEFFQISTDGFLDGKNQGSTRKEAIMTQSQHLIQTIAGRPSAAKSSGFLSSLLLLVAMVGIMLPGCGVKTAPRADTDNLRPTLPFKPRATKSSKTKPRAAVSEKGANKTKSSKAKSP